MPFFQFNLPNRITLSRLVASVGVFVLIAKVPTDSETARHTHALWTLLLFIAVAATDWLDGYLARRLGQVTAFGRILDPFVDKVTVCGAFIMLLQLAPVNEVLAPWMVVVIVAREFFVNSIRGYAESKGVNFGAEMPGKIKMLIQCFTVGFLLGRVAFGNVLGCLDGLNIFWVWATLISTVGSGVFYAMKAARLLKNADV